jgi:hypothetical protein
MAEIKFDFEKISEGCPFQISSYTPYEYDCIAKCGVAELRDTHKEWVRCRQKNCAVIHFLKNIEIGDQENG